MSAPPASPRAAIMAEAAAMLGTVALAEQLGISRRNLAYWKKGEKDGNAHTAGDDALRALLPLLDDHIARSSQLRREVLAELFASTTAQPSRADRGHAAAELLAGSKRRKGADG